jgi:hypothetical protein
MQSDAPRPPAARSPDRGVFISHGHADAELAEALARLLQHFLGLRPDQITCSSTQELGVGNPLTGETLPVSYGKRRVTLRVLKVKTAPGATDSVLVQACR